MSRRNPQRSGDKRTRFLANRVVQVVRRILTKGLASPMDPGVHVPPENLVHQSRQEAPGEAVEVRVDVPGLDDRGRPVDFSSGGAAVPPFTLRIGYYDEPIAGRHRVRRWSDGGIEHIIYLNTRVSEIDRRRTGWYDLAAPWKALTPRLKHSDPTREVVFKLSDKVVASMASTLVHEVTHLIDWRKGRVPLNKADSAQRKRAAADAAEGRSGGRRYYNDPLETNAYFQQVSHGQVGVARVLLKSLQDGTITLAAAVKRFKMLWPSASAFAADTLRRMGQYTNLEMMSGSTRKHLIKRAAGLYETLREDLRRVAKGKLRRNPVLSFDMLGGEEFADQWLEDGEEIAADKKADRPHAIYKIDGMTLHVVTRSEGRVVEWALKKGRSVIGAGGFGVTREGVPQEFGVAFAKRYRGKGLHRKVLHILRHEHFKRPLESDKDRSYGNGKSWEHAGATFDEKIDRYRLNPRRRR